MPRAASRVFVLLVAFGSRGKLKWSVQECVCDRFQGLTMCLGAARKDHTLPERWMRRWLRKRARFWV
eukprot:3253442-Prymnesium_polylepis.1